MPIAANQLAVAALKLFPPTCFTSFPRSDGVTIWPLPDAESCDCALGGNVEVSVRPSSRRFLVLASVLVASSSSQGLAQTTLSGSPATNAAPGASVVATDAGPPPDYQAIYEQAVIESAAGGWERSRAMFVRAHELYPNAYTLRGLGRAELELGHASTAAELLAHALESRVNPLTPQVRPETEKWLLRARALQAPPAPAAPPTVMVAPAPPPEPAAGPEPVRERSRVDVAGGFQLRTLIPLEGYAETTQGVAVGGSVWIEVHRTFAIEPHATLAFDVADETRGYLHIVPLELGAYKLIPFGEHALFVGPGFGWHAIFEQVDVDRSLGAVIMTRTQDTKRDHVFGVGLFARLGVLLFHGSFVSVAASVDYAVTFADFATSNQEQAVRGNLLLLFGGGR